MSASATTESRTTSPAEDVTLADATTEQLGSEPLAETSSLQAIEPARPTHQDPVDPAPVSAAPRTDRESSTQTLSIIAFVLSVAAIITPSFVLLPIASLVLSIIALSRKPRAKGFALAAVIISGAMLAVALVIAVVAALFMGVAFLGAVVY